MNIGYLIQMATTNGNESTVDEENLTKPDLFDIKAILNKVENGNTSEPDIPTKSSTEILSELFGAFNAEPPKIPERTEKAIGTEEKKIENEAGISSKSKKNKKSKKKHKHKEKKHKKKSKLKKKQGSSDDSDDGHKKHRQPSDRKKKKKQQQQTVEVQVKDSDIKIMPNVDPVSIKITTDSSNNVKRTVECSINEPSASKVSPKPEEVPLKPKEITEDVQPKDPVPSVPLLPTKPTTDVKTKPGKIVIKNLKFSSVFEETVRQVEEQAKLKAERYEEDACEPGYQHLSDAEIVNNAVGGGEPMLVGSEGGESDEETSPRCFLDDKAAKMTKLTEISKETNFRSRSVSREKRTESPERSNSRPPSRECSQNKQCAEKKRSLSRERTRHGSQSSDSHSKKRSNSGDSNDRSRKHSKCSHSRHESQSKDKSKFSKHSHSKHRSQSPDNSRKRKHSKHSRSHSRHRSESESRSEKSKRSKRSRSRSHSRRRSQSVSRSDKKRSRHSRSRSHSRRRSESTGRSDKSKRFRRSRSRDSSSHIDKQKLLEIARKNAMNLLKQGVLPSSVVTQDKVVAIKAGGKSVAELTDFCKQLSKKEALGQVSSDSEGEEHHSSGSDAERPFHHPFQIKERPSAINSVQLPLKTLQEKTAEQSKQLRIQFPVSSGQQHRKTENEWVPVSPKKEEPAAVVAPKTAVNNEGLDIGSIMQMWAESKQQPGQFTGSTGARVLSAAELSSGYQAWAKKVQTDVSLRAAGTDHLPHWGVDSVAVHGQFWPHLHFVEVLSAAQHLKICYRLLARLLPFVKIAAALSYNCEEASHRSGKLSLNSFTDQLTTASPVSGGMGMALLQKMGWRPGEGLGKNKEGTLEPLKLEIKMDKKGLVSQEELGRRPVPPIPQTPTTKTLVGKHPVSLLVEFCSKRRWGVPQFELCFECGPDHRKNFLVKVRVNGNEYKPSVASPNKKQAKAEAATICLQALGVLPP
ncbi:hypothetical protein C0J52_01778 [Blattella germanica]|nr:hypothetical protein C0J52_01778 [Blattella germanica]